MSHNRHPEGHFPEDAICMGREASSSVIYVSRRTAKTYKIAVELQMYVGLCSIMTPI